LKKLPPQKHSIGISVSKQTLEPHDSVSRAFLRFDPAFSKALPTIYSRLSDCTITAVFSKSNTTDLHCWLSGQASVGFLPLAENIFAMSRPVDLIKVCAKLFTIHRAFIVAFPVPVPLGIFDSVH
jgi:hypothetical protein